VGIGQLAVVQDNDPDQRPLALRMIWKRLVKLTVSVQGPRIVELLLLVVGYLGQARGIKPMAAPSTAGLVVDLKCIGNPTF